MTQRLPKNFQIAISLFLIVLVLASISLVKNKRIEPVIHIEKATADTFFFDLEGATQLENLNTLKTGNASSGKVSCMLDENNEFSVTFSRLLTDLRDHKKYSEVNFSFSIFTPVSIGGASVVYSLNNNNDETSDYQSQEIKVSPGTWQKVNFTYSLNDKFRNENGRMKLYVWNKQKEKFIIDDLLIHFK